MLWILAAVAWCYTQTHKATEADLVREGGTDGMDPLPGVSKEELERPDTQTFHFSSEGKEEQSLDPNESPRVGPLAFGNPSDISTKKVAVGAFSYKEHGEQLFRGMAAYDDLVDGDEVFTIRLKHTLNDEMRPPEVWKHEEECLSMWQDTHKYWPAKHEYEYRSRKNHIFETALFRLIIQVLYVKSEGPVSIFHSWLESIPDLSVFRKFYPLAASDKVLREFKALPIVSDVAVNRAQYWKMWNDLTEAECLSMKVTFKEFLWAACVVRTRAFYEHVGKVTWKGEAFAQASLVPMADLANSRLGKEADANARWPCQHAHVPNMPCEMWYPFTYFNVTLTEDVAKGEEIFMHRETAANDVHMLNSGVWYADNPQPVKELGDKTCEDILLPAAQKYIQKVGEEENPQTACLEGSSMVQCGLARLVFEHCREVGEYPPEDVDSA